jgi:hypothetical protein
MRRLIVASVWGSTFHSDCGDVWFGVGGTRLHCYRVDSRKRSVYLKTVQ